MSFIERYKKGFALFFGSVCFIVGLFRLAIFVLGLLPEKLKFADVWSWGNVIFIALGIILLWGEITSFAQSIQDSAKSLLKKKTS